MNINDLPFDPQISDDKIKQGMSWLEASRRLFGGCTNFLVICEKNNVPRIEEPCHGAMTAPVYPETNGERLGIATEIGIHRVNRGDLADPFLDWFINKSFFSRFILNRDDFEFCKNYGIVLSSDMPSPLLQNILIISRHFRECANDSFCLFNRLYLEEGYPGTVAYSVAFNSSVSLWDYYYGTEDEARNFKKHPFYSKGSHRAWYVWSDMTSFHNFMKGDFGPTLTDNANTFFRKNPTVYGGASYCTHGGDRSISETFAKRLKDSDKELAERLREFNRTKEKVASVISNPFTIKKATIGNPNTMKVAEVVDCVLPYLKEKGEFSCAAC